MPRKILFIGLSLLVVGWLLSGMAWVREKQNENYVENSGVGGLTPAEAQQLANSAKLGKITGTAGSLFQAAGIGVAIWGAMRLARQVEALRQNP
ncbi:MAG: hypothetical protein R3F11_21875 [Verrucomicrobiales bacterium]